MVKQKNKQWKSWKSYMGKQIIKIKEPKTIDLLRIEGNKNEK